MPQRLFCLFDFLLTSSYKNESIILQPCLLANNKFHSGNSWTHSSNKLWIFEWHYCSSLYGLCLLQKIVESYSKYLDIEYAQYAWRYVQWMTTIRMEISKLSIMESFHISQQTKIDWKDKSTVEISIQFIRDDRVNEIVSIAVENGRVTKSIQFRWLGARKNAQVHRTI